jgi:hypothetical protein
MGEKIRRYCEPQEAGFCSEARAVGRRIARLLDAMGDVNTWIVEGQIADDCRDFRIQVIDRLRAEGWRISIPAEHYRVLPPKGGR